LLSRPEIIVPCLECWIVPLNSSLSNGSGELSNVSPLNILAQS